MGPKEVLSYVTGADVIAEHLEKERDINEVYGLGHELRLPFEAGWSQGVDILCAWTLDYGKYLGTMTLRLTGVDVAMKVSRMPQNLSWPEIPEELERKAS